MSNFYFAKGKIHYKESDGWVILECPHDIVNYYKWWIEKFIWKKISTSYHKPHVTVLPAKHNGDFRKHPAWRKHEGKEVEFLYYPTIYTDKGVGADRYFWLRVECPIVAEIRQDFGLNPNLKFPLHLTIGHLGY